MALSGYFYGTTSNARIKPKLTWSAVQSVEGNYSDITVTLSYSRTNSGYKTEGEWQGTIHLGDQQETGQKRLSITYGSDTQALTATFRVFHDIYGQLKVTLWAEGSIYQPADSSLKSTTISAQIQPDAILRATTLSTVNATIGSRATVVMVRKSTAFSHSLCYSFGALTGWISPEGEHTEEEKRFTGETVNFLVPESFYGQIPNAPSGQCSLTCRTYQEDVLIGEQSAVFTVTADPRLCAPSVTVDARDTNPVSLGLTGDENRFIRYISRLQCNVQADARQGATLVEIKAEDTTVSDGVYRLESLDRERIRFTATDSRGYTTTLTVQLPMIPYVVLTGNAAVRRTDPTGGDAVLTLQGNCWCGSFPQGENTLTASCTAGENTVQIPLEIQEDHTYRAEIILTGLDYRQSHPVEVTVSDRAMRATQTLTVQKGLPVFHWGEGDFQFQVPVDLPALTINGTPLADYIRSIMDNG